MEGVFISAPKPGRSQNRFEKIRGDKLSQRQICLINPFYTPTRTYDYPLALLRLRWSFYFINQAVLQHNKKSGRDYSSSTSQNKRGADTDLIPKQARDK